MRAPQRACAAGGQEAEGGREVVGMQTDLVSTLARALSVHTGAEGAAWEERTQRAWPDGPECISETTLRSPRGAAARDADARQCPRSLAPSRLLQPRKRQQRLRPSARRHVTKTLNTNP